jgi:hypothetical protein
MALVRARSHRLRAQTLLNVSQRYGFIAGRCDTRTSGKGKEGYKKDNGIFRAKRRNSPQKHHSPALDELRADLQQLLRAVTSQNVTKNTAGTSIIQHVRLQKRQAVRCECSHPVRRQHLLMHVTKKLCGWMATYQHLRAVECDVPDKLLHKNASGTEATYDTALVKRLPPKVRIKLSQPPQKPLSTTVTAGPSGPSPICCSCTTFQGATAASPGSFRLELALFPAITADKMASNPASMMFCRCSHEISCCGCDAWAAAMSRMTKAVAPSSDLSLIVLGSELHSRSEFRKYMRRL